PVAPKLAFASRQSFTLECWFELSATDNSTQVILARGPEATGYVLELGKESDGMRVYFSRHTPSESRTVATIDGAHPAVGTPHHLVAVYDGTDITTYLDDVRGEST